MIGLIFLSVLGLWLIATHWIALFATRKLRGLWRALAYVAALPLVYLLPVADEIVAERQIERLCREGAVLKIDAQKIKGRRVKLSFEPSNADVPGIAVPVTYTKVVYRDAQTGEELGSRGNYVIAGGWLIRASGISENDSPVWIGENYCAPDEGSQQAAKRFGFQIIN